MISINIYGCQPFYSLILIRKKKYKDVFSLSFVKQTASPLAQPQSSRVLLGDFGVLIW